MSYDNILLHGDSLEIIKEIPEETFDFIFTDPPYGQDMMYGRRENGRTILGDDNNFLQKLPEFAKDCYRVLRFDKFCVIFGQWRTYSIFESAFLSAGFALKTVGIWDKCVQGLGEGFVEAYEQFMIFRKGEARNNYYMSNIIKEPRPNGIRLTHPNEKPVKLCRKIIHNCTKENELVADFFVGTGNNILACMDLERKFFGVELAEEYYLEAVARQEELRQRHYKEQEIPFPPP